jgi:hypothetical protein
MEERDSPLFVKQRADDILGASKWAVVEYSGIAIIVKSMYAKRRIGGPRLYRPIIWQNAPLE